LTEFHTHRFKKPQSLTTLEAERDIVGKTAYLGKVPTEPIPNFVRLKSSIHSSLRASQPLEKSKIDIKLKINCSLAYSKETMEHLTSLLSPFASKIQKRVREEL
jgi:hypothetical protein